MSHIFCHNITTYSRRRSEHNKDCNDFFILKSQPDCDWQKDCRKSDKLHNSRHNRRFGFRESLWISKVAPIAISPIGVAMFPILVTVFAGIPENGRRHADQRSPITIPIIIGLVIIPFNVFFSTSLSILLCPGLKKGQHNNRHNIIKRDTADDHDWRHTRISINILDKCNTQEAPRCFDKKPE